MENTRNHDRDLSRTEIESAIDEWIIGKNAERDRKVLRRRLIDGVTFERLAEEQELSVIRKDREAVARDVGKDKAHDAERGKFDDPADALGDRISRIAQERLCIVSGHTECDTKKKGPCENTEEVRIHDGADGVVHDIEQDILEHLEYAFRRCQFFRRLHKLQCRREEEAGDDGARAGCHRTDRIKDDDRLHICLLTGLMLRNRRHDEHKDHERGDRFERTDKKTTEDAKESKRTRDPHRDRDTDEQADDDLSDQAQFVPTIDDVFHNATYCASICMEQIGEKVISYVRDQRPCLFILS